MILTSRTDKIKRKVFDSERQVVKMDNGNKVRDDLNAFFVIHPRRSPLLHVPQEHLTMISLAAFRKLKGFSSRQS
jgi:hypothetical protein